ncbi:hypothetical protein FQA39_LY07608 [Lamprigera yunnana]|nr:hypothetical protein FQA39_LY07608 [Lamprigera yunnana]
MPSWRPLHFKILDVNMWCIAISNKDLNDSDEEDMVVDGGEDTCGSSNSSEKMNSDTEDSESEEVPVLPQSDSEEDINFEINDFVVTKFTTGEDNRCRLLARQNYGDWNI